MNVHLMTSINPELQPLCTQHPQAPCPQLPLCPMPYLRTSEVVMLRCNHKACSYPTSTCVAFMLYHEHFIWYPCIYLIKRYATVQVSMQCLWSLDHQYRGNSNLPSTSSSSRNCLHSVPNLLAGRGRAWSIWAWLSRL